MLRRWFVRCPRCAEVWLVVGAREDDRHVCKGCGHGFVIRLSTEQAGDTPTPKGAA
jgi:rRNA maturation endonuclease Nob1